MTRTKVSTTQPLAYYDCDETHPPVEDCMTALTETGIAVTASSSSAKNVIGVCSGIRNKRVLILDELLVMDNDATNPVKRQHRGSPCYVAGETTVTSAKPASGLVAGLVVDVDDEGVTVDFSPAAIAAAKALVPTV